MKQYFFFDRECQELYEVKAENYQEARKVMFEYLEKYDEYLDDDYFDEFIADLQPCKIN
jgi:hypothetical protein